MNTIAFAKKIYDEPCVTEAIAAFEDLGSFTKELDGDHIRVAVTDVDADFEPHELLKELANYVLSLTIVHYVENTF